MSYHEYLHATAHVHWTGNVASWHVYQQPNKFRQQDRYSIAYCNQSWQKYATSIGCRPRVPYKHTIPYQPKTSYFYKGWTIISHAVLPHACPTTTSSLTSKLTGLSQSRSQNLAIQVSTAMQHDHSLKFEVKWVSNSEFWENLDLW